MTADGALESLERSIQSRLGKLGRTPPLHLVIARELLEEVAYRRWRDVTTGAVTMAELVAAFRWLNRPPELDDAEQRAIVARLIDDGGILLAEDGGFRFACQTVQDYLAACRIVQRHPRGPCRWSWRTSEYRAPRTSWRWPDTEVMLFLTALWWRKAQSAVDRQLRRLLRDQHRDPNMDFVIDFVIELIQRNWIPGSDIRERIVHLLGRDFDDGQLEHRRWKAAVERLHRLDPTLAIAKLEKIILDPSQTAERIYDALFKLIKDKYHPARGAENLTILAHQIRINKPTRAPKDRYNIACKIACFDNRELSAETMRQLADSPEMGELRVDAAIRANLPELLRKLIEPEHGIFDNGRLKLLEELLRGWDRPMAVAAAERIAQTARQDDTPLRIVRMIMIHDGYKHHDEYKDVAWRIAYGVAWPTNPKIGSSAVRLDAVILIGEIKPAEAILQLERLSQDQSGSMTGEDRVKAAMRIVTEHGGSITAVVNLGDDPKLDRTNRVKAAKFVGKRDRATGARLYISIAKTCIPKDKSRLELLREAYKLGPEPAANALAEVAEDERIPGPIRCEAVEIASPTLDRQQRTIGLYTTIAKTTDNASALAAARKVKERNLDAGQRLMGELADQRKDTKFRLTAALEAGIYGKRTLMDIAETAQSDTDVFEAAKGLLALRCKKEAERVLQKLIKKHRAGKVRIDAALALPETSAAVDALITITEDHREKENIHSDARQALRKLANTQGISETTRKKVHQHLNK